MLLISPGVWTPPRWSPCTGARCCSRGAGWSWRSAGRLCSGSSWPCPSWTCTAKRNGRKSFIYYLIWSAAGGHVGWGAAHVMTGCLLKSGSQAPVSLLETGHTWRQSRRTRLWRFSLHWGALSPHCVHTHFDLYIKHFWCVEWAQLSVFSCEDEQRLVCYVTHTFLHICIFQPSPPPSVTSVVFLLSDEIVMSVCSSSPQSACLVSAAFCTALGLPGFCTRVRHVQLSAPPRPEIPEIWRWHKSTTTTQKNIVNDGPKCRDAELWLGTTAGQNNYRLCIYTFIPVFTCLCSCVLHYGWLKWFKPLPVWKCCCVGWIGATVAALLIVITVSAWLHCFV